MEFWGVEVKAGETLNVSPGEGKLLHLSHASIGDSKKGKGENVSVFVKVDEQKLVIGTLSVDKFPQIQYDVIFVNDFELSHNGKNQSIFFCGYKTQNHEEDGGCSSDSEEFDESDSEDELPLENEKPTPAIANLAKPSPPAKSVQTKETKADNDEDSGDEDDSDDITSDLEDSDDDEMDSDDFDSSDEEEEEEEKAPTPKKDDKKRPVETTAQVSSKKAKLVTPQKTAVNKPAAAAAAHTATPHPGKQVGKTPKNDNNSKTLASAGKSHSNAKKRAAK